MSHPFPESSSLNSGRRGQCDREKYKAKAQPWAVCSVGCSVRLRAPVHCHLMPLPMSHIPPSGPPQPRDLVSQERRPGRQANSWDKQQGEEAVCAGGLGEM